ncbi:DUF1569 domain-containing protein [Curvibacter sp. CHRR-16]|uniref:DUF1569 domain-containing protein n=1 Tax=Curvibacter sp. CHRR-16 TaxID=2835872 RepID=UPI002023A88B|nr:DUF1569 domain-containing protein [Curvibacter sp. CHRR-16]
MADTPKVESLSDVLRWLDKLEKAKSVQSTTAWSIGAVMEHMSQSVEMSMDGFPEPKGALFQATVGSAAFAVFKWRGKMSHGLTDPIPGAPVLAQSTDWHAGVQRLRAAVDRFNKHSGALMPHFAYGALSRADFALAHAMHIANHQDEIVVA